MCSRVLFVTFVQYRKRSERIHLDRLGAFGFVCVCSAQHILVYMWDAWLFNCSISNCGKARALNHPKKQKLLLCIKIYDCIYYPFCTFSASCSPSTRSFLSFSLIRSHPFTLFAPLLLFPCVIEHSPLNSRAVNNDVLRAYMTRNKRNVLHCENYDWMCSNFEVIFSYYVHFKQQMNRLKNLCKNKIKFLWTISFRKVKSWMCVDYYNCRTDFKVNRNTKRKILLSEMCVIKINQKAKL